MNGPDIEPAIGTPFVGRDRELSELHRAEDIKPVLDEIARTAGERYL